MPERYTVGAIVPSASENLREHYKKLIKDKEYRKNTKQQYQTKLKGSSRKSSIDCSKRLQKNCKGIGVGN